MLLYLVGGEGGRGRVVEVGHSYLCTSNVLRCFVLAKLS